MKLPSPALALLLVIAAQPAFAQMNVGLTAVFDPQKNQVKIRWQQTDSRNNRFILQKSSDEKFWSDVYEIFITGAAKEPLIKFNDTKTGAGKNYYRLKVYQGTNYGFTNAVMVIVGRPGNNWVMYPVPVQSVLNLQYNGTATVSGVISVVLQSATTGIVFSRLRLASNTRLIQIPVTNLGRGTYDVRIYLNNEVVWNQRFVKGS